MKNLNVWSPRPNAIKKETLSDAVVIYGLPVMQIVPLDITAQAIDNLAASDTFIFTSQPAVLHSMDAIRELCHQRHILAIGQATRDCLLKHQISATMTASPPFTSEALVQDLLNPRHLANHNKSLPIETISIIGGENSRPYLRQQLQKQGKKVFQINCYQREKSPLSDKVMVEFITEHSINAILITSCEMADRVSERLKRVWPSAFTSCPVFTFSQRIATHLEAGGFKHIITAPSASQKALNETILAWWKNRISE